MQKHPTKNTHVTQLHNQHREAIRYVPIPTVAADSILEHFVAYEQRLMELEEQITRKNALRSIDIDRL